MLSFFARDVLFEIWDLIESVSEGYPIYFSDNQKWIFNTKGQHSVKTESRLCFLFPVKNVGAVTILLLCSFSGDALYFVPSFVKYLNSVQSSGLS